MENQCGGTLAERTHDHSPNLGLWRCSQAWKKSEARASHPQVDEGQCEYKSPKRPPGRGPRKFELKTACIEAGERRNNDPAGATQRKSARGWSRPPRGPIAAAFAAVRAVPVLQTEARGRIFGVVLCVF